MSRRKQSNPQHLGLDRELPASTFENGPPPGDTPVHANAHRETGGADEVNGDVHVCGKCRGEFIIISEFLQHKQTCCKDPTVVIVNEGGHRNSENTDNNPQSKPEEVGAGEGGEGEINEDENEMGNKDDAEDTKDKLEDGIKQSLTPEVPKSEASESQEAVDFTVNQPIAKSESGRSPIANGLNSLSLPPSNLTLSNMEHTKYAVSQICQSLSPPTREDMAIIQEQLYTLQQQHLQQLQLIQHIQQQVNSYTAQQQKLEPPKSSSPSSTSSTPTLPTISLPSGSQVPPPPHLLSPPTSTTSVLPPSFDPLPPSHPSHRPGPPPSGILPPGAFPLPPHRPPFELLQQAAIPPVSSPLHSVPPAPFGGPAGPGGLLGLHRKGKPPNVSIFDSKFAADDPFFRHKCRFCHKVFGSDSALQIHIRSHTGERPFKCNICGNRFSTKGNLKVHFQRHQARYPHIQMDTTPHPPSPPPQERPSQMSQPPIHPPSIHQVPMPTIPNDIAKLPVETTNASHQAVQPSSGSPNTSINSDEFPVKATTNDWHPPMASPNVSASSTVERPPRPLSEPPRPASEPARCSSEPRTAPETTRPASSSDIAIPRSSLSPVAPRESPPSPPTIPTAYPQFLPPSSRPDDSQGSMSMEYGTPSSLKLLAEQGFRPSETSKLQELVENIEQKITDPNQCVICHRVLSCKSALQMHYRIHTGERPFRCKICSRSFTTKGNLKTHYGVHRTQPPIRTYHDCPICQKRFTNEIVLQQHLRLHAAEGIPIPNSMNFMRPQMGSYGPEIALQRPMPMMNGERPRHHDFERSERSAMMSGERPHHHDIERSERSTMMNGERLHHSDNERSEQPMMMNGERPRLSDNERSERPMMMNGERPHHNDNDRSEQEGTLTNVSGSLSNGPSLSNGQTSDEMLTREKNVGHEREKEVKDNKREDRMEDGEEADGGLTEKDIEEAMFTPSEPSQGDAASPPASFTEDSQQPPERQLLNHFERRPSEIELAHQHRYDHQRSLDNITNALKMKMASAPLNNNTEIRGPVSANEEQFSEPQSPLSKSEENSMTSEKPSDVQSFGEDNLEHPLHIDESRMDSNGVLDLTSRSSGETSPSMPQSQGLPTSTAAMFAGLGAPNLLLAQGPGGLIYPPGRRPTNNNTTCQFCGKVFACTSALQIHYRSHTKERPFKCDICGKGFSTRGNLKQHMLTHKIRDLPAQLFDPTRVQHSGPIVPLPPKVPEIPEVPKLEPEQKVDSQPVHPSLKRPSPPTSCENEPPMKRTLKHQCSVCEKQFQSDSALQIHMRTHTGEKPFKCHICGRAFTTKGNMKVHMGTHMWNGGTRRGRRIAFDPPLIISPKEGEVFRNDFLGMRPPFDGSFFQYPSPLNGFTALSKTNEISVIQNHQTGPQQAHIPESPNSVIMKADGPNPEMRELRELREMQENKIREMHETSMRELHENSIREMHEKSFREMHENKIREMHESKMRELHENKIREMHEHSIREMRENTIRELRENAMREMRENALREMRESTMREMRENAMRDLKPEAEPERLATAPERLATAPERLATA